jgi:outer membrane protein insertion porin family
MIIPRRSPLGKRKPAIFSVFRPLFLLACVLLVSIPGSAQEAQIEGQTVAEVRVVDASGNPVTQKIPELPLAAGKPFDFGVERESLRVLYRTGDYSDIRVSAAPVAQGWRVDFVVELNLFNNVVRINGLKPPPTEAAALAAMGLNLGEIFRQSAVQQGVERLEETLRSDGFYQAKVSSRVEPDNDTRQMNVIVDVDSGIRARIGDVTIENHTSYADTEILRHAGLLWKKEPPEFTAARISRASDKLKKFMVNQGYLGANAVLTAGSYDGTSNRVPVKLSANAGARVLIEVSGAHLSGGTKRRLLPMYAEGAADEDLLQEGRRNLRDYFQSQGYFNVDVQVASSAAAGGERVINYQVTRGDRFRMVGVGFDGNKYFESKLLAGRLQLQPAAFASSGKFSQQLMREDADSIRGIYVANGFGDAQVTTSVDDSYHGKKNNLFVTFHVVEGAQTRISSLKIEGNQAISTATLTGVIGSTPGQPYSEEVVASDRNNILSLYYNEGFPEATFHEVAAPGPTPAATPTATPTDVLLVYQLTEGQQIRVSKVLLTGYQYTRPGIIAKQVAIDAGGPLRESDVAQTQRQLYNLGIFTRVQIAEQNPSGTDPDKAVVVGVEEGDRYTIGYGFGFEIQRIAGGSTNPNGTTLGASPRGIFEFARNNLFGRAETLSFQARASTLEYRVAETFTAGNLFNDRNFTLQVTGFADKTQDVNTFTSSRFEGGLQVVEKLSSSSSLLYRYFYRRVKASNLVATINPEQIPLLSQPTLVSGFGITYTRDRRDNPADPARGNFNTIDLSDAIDTIGSSASFLRFYYQNSSFYSLGRSFVLARSLRFGVETPLGHTTEGNVPFNPAQCTATPPTITPQVIPLPERFFAGGGTSLRGFGLNQAGPRDPCTGFPVGGLATLVLNQELHFPMKLPYVGNKLGGTLFYDAGNVYRDIYHISFSWRSPSTTNIDYMSHTVGFGFRYPTPVGPVRFDIGYQLNPPDYRAIIPPSTTAQTLRLSHFGFSFNIGPVF